MRYCPYCNERLNSRDHSRCSSENEDKPTYYRIFVNDKRISTVRVLSDGTLFEIYPHTYIIYNTEKDWRAAYPLVVVPSYL